MKVSSPLPPNIFKIQIKPMKIGKLDFTFKLKHLSKKVLESYSTVFLRLNC